MGMLSLSYCKWGTKRIVGMLAKFLRPSDRVEPLVWPDGPRSPKFQSFSAGGTEGPKRFQPVSVAP